MRLLTSIILECSVVAVALAGAMSAFAADGDSSTYRGGLTRTGVYDTKPTKSTSITAKWRFETGSFVRASAAIMDDAVLFGSGDGNFYSLGAKNGKLKWKLNIGKPIYSTATIAEGIAYFTDGDGSLYAVDATAGSLKWTRKQEKPISREGWDFWHSSPAVVDGIVYYGSGDGNVWAVSAVDASPIWSFKTKGRVRSSPSVVDGSVIVASWDANLYSLDAKTGALKWKFKAGDAIQCAPAIGNGMAYVTSRDCQLYAIDMATGVKKWSANFPGSWVLTSPALASDKVVVGTSDLQTVECFQASTGKALWKCDVKNNVLSSPCIAGDWVYACGWDGYVHVINLNTGKEPGFRGYVEGQIQSSPVPYSGCIYVGSDDHCMYMMN